MPRRVSIERATSETKIALLLDLDGGGRADVATGVGFFDHMLTHLARHGLFDIALKCDGDLHIDAHHTVEDCGIALGSALAQALGDKAGIRRYGDAAVPMDEALAQVAVDLGGRAVFVWRADVPNELLGNFSSQLAEEFWRAFAGAARMNLHVSVPYGRNTHHVIEGIFKAAARALRQAVELDPRVTGVPSTKGTL
jgi:imidazoleglycerol-phosphate dehydratase